jgi:hypothetical protein
MTFSAKIASKKRTHFCFYSAPCHTMTYKNGGWVEDPRGSHMSLGLYPGYNNYTTHLYCSPKNAEGADSETRARLLDIAKK